MITLPHHVEFLSDAWLDEAHKFAVKEVAIRKERLGGKPFSLSERFDNAPPHLGLPGNVAAWTLRYDGETATVARGFDDSADVKAQGAYQAALTSAQFVGVLAPGAQRGMIREVRTMFGKDAIRLAGNFPNEQATQFVLLLHDHMGRRTVENPDLAHRAAAQGLTRKIREMEEQGYTVIERAISAGFADAVRDATIKALLPHQTTSMNWMLYHRPRIRAVDPEPAADDVGRCFARPRRGDRFVQFDPARTRRRLHPDAYRLRARARTVSRIRHDRGWRVGAGRLDRPIRPDLDRARQPQDAPPPAEGEGRNDGVPIEMPKGSVVFFTHGVWHWQGDRSEPGDRVTLHAHFNRGILRSLEPKKTDVQMLHRNAPRLGEMLGEDDWFDKMSAEGRDYGRYVYMNKLHAFTEQQKRAILAG